jgi:hypothetical protein
MASSNPTLYLLVWECEEYATEAEWMHFVSDKPVIEYEEQIKIAQKFMQGQRWDDDSDEVFDIENIWLNAVTTVDGYTVTLNKEGA